jgi:hypothetical protein
MKNLLSLGLALLAVASAQAQIFRSAAANGALIGGVAGAIVGNNSGSLHHDALAGAAIGATTGLVVGSIVDSSHAKDVWHDSGAPAPSPYVYRGASAYGSYPAAGGYYYSRPDYRTTGVILGGVAGAIIGSHSHGSSHVGYGYHNYGYHNYGYHNYGYHNYGHYHYGYGYGNPWYGAVWGASLGYLVGSIAENHAQYQEALAAPAPAPAAAPAPQPVTIINNYYNAPATPMSAANGLFGR